MMDYQVDKSSFITLIKEGLNLQHMQIIPPEFVKYLGNDYFSRHLILIGPSGDQWQVTCFKKEDNIFMQNGWPKFLRDNMIEPHQLLLFTCDGENRFRVQIFGINGCERLNTKKAGSIEAASTSQPIPIDFVKLIRLEEMAPKEFILRNYSGRKGWFVESRVGNEICFGDGWEQFVEENCLEEDDFIICKYDGQKEMKLKILKLYGWEKIGAEDEGMNAIENDYILDIKEEEEEEGSIEEEWVMEHQDDDSDDESEEEHLGRGSHQRFGKALVGKRGTAGTSATKNCPIDEEKYVHPDNPYFTATLLKKRANELRVPKQLIDDFSLNLPQRITFHCLWHAEKNEVPEHHLTSPKESHVRKISRMATGEKQKWRDGRVMYRGFARFCRINNIDVEKDKCICEFVLGEDQQIQIYMPSSIATLVLPCGDDWLVRLREVDAKLCPVIEKLFWLYLKKRTMAMASATMSSASLTVVGSATVGSSRRRKHIVHYITGLNSFGGLKAQNFVTSLGLPVCTEQSFSKVVSFLKSPSKGKGRGGGAASSTCNAAGEIFQIAAILNGLVLVGVAVGFVLLRIEASVEEAE
ncbi:hypothetical protein RIF29_32212 [Crotalaria pallida]|uniref:TF-B3 domain-containing protein n=1 Tax=Crotalaria pallida TaxID=3830 RepID=A0AAN9EIR8_CROPI